MEDILPHSLGLLFIIEQSQEKQSKKGTDFSTINEVQDMFYRNLLDEMTRV